MNFEKKISSVYLFWSIVIKKRQFGNVIEKERFHTNGAIFMSAIYKGAKLV